MMKTTHQQICAYLQNNCRPEELANIEQLRRDDQVLDLLFQLLDELKKYSTVKESKILSGFANGGNIEETLESLLGGNLSPTKAHLFIERLLRFPPLAERIYRRLALLTQNPNDEDVLESGLVTIKSDNELLQEIKSASTESLKEKIDRFKRQFSLSVDAFWTGVLRPSAKPVLRRVAAAVSMVALAVTIILLVIKPYGHTKDREVNKIITSSVPCPYESTSFRGAGNQYSENALFNTFIIRFKSDISDYLSSDFPTTIMKLEKLDSIARALRQQTQDKAIPPVLWDYYFYLGQSHLALINNKEQDAVGKKQHIDQALACFAQAAKIASTLEMSDTDKDNFYLGIAYELTGKTDSALIQLKMIKQNSFFYEKGSKLINLLATH